jgi:hypothetical protein
MDCGGAQPWSDPLFVCKEPPGARVLLYTPIPQIEAAADVQAGAWGSLYTPIPQIEALSDIAIDASAALYTPIPQLEAYAVVPNLTRLSLHTPIPQIRSLSAVAIDGHVALYTPIPQPQSLAAVRSDAQVALYTPLPEIRAYAGIQVATIPPAPRIARRLLLSEPMPLERTTNAEQYATADAIPWVYGRVSLELLPADEQGLRWIIAGHPVAAVRSVNVDGVVTTGWAYGVEDGVAMLTLSQPADRVTAHVVGAVDNEGAIDEPGRVLRDLGRRCGLTASRRLFRDLRGVQVGIVYHAADPLREAGRAIAGPLDAIWGESDGEIWGWGRDAAPADPVPLTRREISSIDSAAAGEELATGARVEWGRDYAGGEPGGVLHLTAPLLESRIRPRIIDIDLGPLRSARDALRFGKAALERRARARWEVRLETARRALRIGERVQIDHPHCPIAEGIVIEVDSQPWQGGGCRAVVEGYASPPPRIVLERRSGYLDALGAEPALAIFDAATGIATVTIYDDIGRPLAGAQVEVEDGIAATTDASGQIQFPALPGSYLLRVFKPGFEPISIEVQV